MICVKKSEQLFKHFFQLCGIPSLYSARQAKNIGKCSVVSCAISLEINFPYLITSNEK